MNHDSEYNQQIQESSQIAARLIVGAVLLGGQALAAAPAAAEGLRPLSSDRMVSHLTARLGLTDAQAAQIKQVLDASRSQMTTQFQALGSARQALRQATLASPVNEGAIRNAAQALAQAQGDAALLRAQVHAQIVPLLTPDQQQKFAAAGTGPRHFGKMHSPRASD